jgi:hypothetical protein
LAGTVNELREQITSTADDIRHKVSPNSGKTKRDRFALPLLTL